MKSEFGKRGSIRRSRAILRAALHTLKRNPRLLWFPVLSVVGLVFLVATGALITKVGAIFAGHGGADVGELWTTLGQPHPARDETVVRAMSIAGIVFIVCGQLFEVAIAVAMTHAALEALAGRDWSLRQSFDVVKRRRGTVVSFAIIRATVGSLLSRSKKDRKGRRKGPGLLRKLAGFAWSAATYLVMPVIAREERGGFGSIERSAKLLRDTWRETLLARLTLGWLWVPAIIVAAVPAILCAALGVRDAAVLAVAIGLPVLAIAIFGLCLHTLDGIYRAALYTYATEGVVPEAFDDASLHEIWEARPDAAGTDGDFIDVPGEDVVESQPQDRGDEEDE